MVAIKEVNESDFSECGSPQATPEIKVPELSTYINMAMLLPLFNRPGVAGAVLQTPL